jgi:hypothetical protein
MTGFAAFGPNPRLDYAIHDTVLAIQELALGRLYHPLLLSRVLDGDTKIAKGEDHVEMAEIFSSLRDSIWKELPPATSTPGTKPPKTAIDSFRRALQRAQLDHLVKLATGSVATAPNEAVALARADLLDLKGRIGAAAKAAGLDASTKAHLAASQSRIEEALDAKVLHGV